MNTTTAIATTAPRRRVGHSIPTAVDIHQIPAIPVSVEDRIAVKIYNFRGEMSDYASNFTLGSVVQYAAKYNEDPAEAIARAESRGHDLYYAISEGAVISAHKMPVVKRTEILLGSIIEMDGKKFQILQSPNSNLQLVPLPTA